MAPSITIVRTSEKDLGSLSIILIELLIGEKGKKSKFMYDLKL